MITTTCARPTVLSFTCLHPPLTRTACVAPRRRTRKPGTQAHGINIDRGTVHASQKVCLAYAVLLTNFADDPLDRGDLLRHRQLRQP